jgi:hypothetical protein
MRRGCEVAAMFGTLVVLGLLQSICVYAYLAHSVREYTYSFYFTYVLLCATLDLLLVVVVLGFGCVGYTPPVSLRALSMLNDETRMPKCGTAAAWHLISANSSCRANMPVLTLFIALTCVGSASQLSKRLCIFCLHLVLNHNIQFPIRSFLQITCVEHLAYSLVVQDTWSYAKCITKMHMRGPVD